MAEEKEKTIKVTYTIRIIGYLHFVDKEAGKLGTMEVNAPHWVHKILMRCPNPFVVLKELGFVVSEKEDPQ